MAGHEDASSNVLAEASLDSTSIRCAKRDMTWVWDFRKSPQIEESGDTDQIRGMHHVAVESLLTKSSSSYAPC
jgi:hypothetical protein